MERHCFRVAVAYMCVTFLIGVLLRMQFVFPLEGFSFGYVKHAHSHVGFLGWVFNGFFALAFRLFVLPEDRSWCWKMFLFCQLGVLGMLVAFPIQGYALWSIVFSTLHLLCSVLFVIRLVRRNRATRVAGFALKLGAWFLLISSVGPFALGPIMVSELRDTIWRDLGVYYYLHFQYNGWFVFFLIAAGLQVVRCQISNELEASVKRYLVLLAVAILLTYAQSALWVDGVEWVRSVACVGGALQLVAVVRLLWLVGRSEAWFSSRLASGLGRAAVGLFVLKVVLQFVVIFPSMEVLGTQHFMVIAFLHLVFLGVVTPLLWAWGIELGFLKEGIGLRIGIALFIVGAVISQLALVYLPLPGGLGWQPIPYLFDYMFYASVAMLVGGVAIGSRFGSTIKSD
ncbi:hypothetical protein MLD52_03575 [Puniceicoccaceae bacterium K14]|nr:hypothetical protein [Puniceicoccaceae bacterium K14]